MAGSTGAGALRVAAGGGAHASTAVTLPAVNSVAQVGAPSVGPFCSTGAAEEQLPGPIRLFLLPASWVKARADIAAPVPP